MTHTEMMKKYLGLIEELNPTGEYLTEDPDIQAKQDEVTNQILFELARFKKIPRYVQLAVTEGQLLTFGDLAEACGREIYQIDRISGVRYAPKASGTVLKMLESGTAEIDLFVYPKRITPGERGDSYVFELSEDALEIMPYGIAADLLKSDVSAQYGQIYAARYNEMLQRLDHRYQLPSYWVEGGFAL